MWCFLGRFCGLIGKMKEKILQKSFDELLNNLPDHLWNVWFSIKDYSTQSGKFVLNGFCGKELNFIFSDDDIKKMYKWLEENLSNNCTQEFFVGKEILSGDEYLVGIKMLADISEDYNHKYWGKGFEMPMKDCCIFYTYNSTKEEIVRTAFCRKEDVLRKIYTTFIKSKGVKLRSSFIENYYQKQEPFRLEYKGYTTVSSIGKYDLRYYGEIYTPAKVKEKNWGFASDNYYEFKDHFESMVDEIISRKEWKRRNEEWKNSGIDISSIACVFDILPDKFRERIGNGKYDKTLNTKVNGGFYEVPLYYVTKAWDVLLKGDLCDCVYKVEYDPDLDDDPVDRLLEQAISQNNEMKALWKDKFDIDIDCLDVDFTLFNRHIIPNVSKNSMYSYFQSVPNGIEEWILDGINFPGSNICFDSVSCLMEFTAYILFERERLGV